MAGMTLKQYHLDRFYRLCAAYKDAANRTSTDDGKRDFVALSVQIHAAKGNVPKAYWGMASLTKRSRERWG